jgi:acetyl-CoA carboxylase carboxyl transferase subunit beta
MGWFTKTKKKQVPENLYTKCKKCEEAIYTKDLEKNLFVCTKCNYHFRLTANQRIELLVDEGTFVEFDEGITAADPLGFVSNAAYSDKLTEAKEKTNLKEAITSGKAQIGGIPIVMGVFNFSFIGGSMGAVVGEKIARCADMAIKEKCGLMLISASGGARMQEGVLSLMQMIKTGQAVARLANEKLPYISFLTDPTTGGVTASFAMLGDVIMAEPDALIGFAGPRVIEQTIKQTLPEGFQRSEFLLKTGVIDMVVHRSECRETIIKMLHFFMKN